jgi:hypothetical protein
MNNLTISTSPERASYDRVRQVLAANGNNPANFIIQPFTMRIEQEISATRSSYNFIFYESRSGDSPSEIKLNRNDSFFASKVALGLAKTTVALPDLGNIQYSTFPDPVIFAGAGEAQALEGFYNGTLLMKTDPVERLKGLYTNHLRYKPQAYDTSVPDPIFGETDERRGFYPLTTETIFDGQENNQAVITLPGNVDMTAAVVDEETNYLILLVHGFLVLNGARKVGKYM